MTTPPITREAFNTLREVFLATQDAMRKDELYATAREIAEGVFSDLETFLFQVEIEKEARRQQWLELCKEFGNNPGETQ